MSDWDDYDMSVYDRDEDEIDETDIDDIDIDPLEFDLKDKLGQNGNNKGCCIVLFIFGASITATVWGITELLAY